MFGKEKKNKKNICQNVSTDEKKYKALVDTSPDCIKLFDLKGNLLYINPGGLEEHGFKSMDEALNGNWLALKTIVGEDQGKFTKALKEAAKGKTTTFEIRHTRKGANREACLETIAPVKNGGDEVVAVFGVSRDITELKRTRSMLEKQIKEKTEDLSVYAEMVKNMSEGAYLVSLDDLTIKYTNPKFEKMFGYEPGEMIGKHISVVNDSFDKDPVETAQKIMKVIRDTGEWHGEVLNVKKDGTPFWCYANVSVFNHDRYGEVLIAVHSDITERKKTEEELEKKVKELSKINEAMIGRELKMIELKKEAKKSNKKCS